MASFPQMRGLEGSPGIAACWDGQDLGRGRRGVVEGLLGISRPSSPDVVAASSLINVITGSGLFSCLIQLI